MNPDQKQTLEALYRWMSRAHFERPSDEVKAAEFAQALRQMVLSSEFDQPDQIDKCRDALTEARTFIVEKRPSMLFSKTETISKYFRLLYKIDVALWSIS